MSPLQVAGIGFLMISAGIFFWMIAHVIYAASRRRAFDSVPMLTYSGISIVACIAGLGLLLV